MQGCGWWCKLRSCFRSMHSISRMEDLPLYGVGISAGSAFLLKMPRYLRVCGTA